MLLLWGFVAGFVVFFHKRAEHHRAQTTLQSVAVDIVDSLPDEMLINSRMVGEWIERSGLATEGTPSGEVNLAAVERTIRQKGFVGRASAYMTYDGRLRVEVSQRKPLMRIMVNGYDSYVTSDGFVFSSPENASAYVPVVTGSYVPPMSAGYVGQLSHLIDSLVSISNEKILALQHEKVPLFERESEIADSVRAVRRMKVKRKGVIRYQGFGESDEAFDQRVKAKRAEKADLRRRYRYWQRVNDKKIADITAQQDSEREKQKKLIKRYEDFLKLINFVKYIEKDDFWRAEVVQIVASTMSSGDLRLELIPRTGSHTVLFGTLNDVEQKLDKLLAFYQKGLSNLGWDSFKSISVEYKNQVVCTKK